MPFQKYRKKSSKYKKDFVSLKAKFPKFSSSSRIQALLCYQHSPFWKIAALALLGCNFQVESSLLHRTGYRFKKKPGKHKAKQKFYECFQLCWYFLNILETSKYSPKICGHFWKDLPFPLPFGWFLQPVICHINCLTVCALASRLP